MGTKNTIDSATMMNKGLEVIEASRLFGLPGDTLQIDVHPQSLAHGFVVFTDGNVKAQLRRADMRLPIGYALAYPDRLDDHARADAVLRRWAPSEASLALLRVRAARTRERFPVLGLAYRALAGGRDPAGRALGRQRGRRRGVRRRKDPLREIPEVVAARPDGTPPGAASLKGVRAADRRARAGRRRLVGAIEGSVSQ